MPDKPLTYEQLREAVAGGAVAIRSLITLQPADGPGGKVFPASYVQEFGAEHKYTVEKRRVEGEAEPVNTVLLDSVASQANRAELALRDAWERDELKFPVAYVDFESVDELKDLGKITVLDAPHRIADAIFRDSMLDDTLFRLSDVGKEITESRPNDATAMFKYAPTALLFGQWDSTGPKGGLGAKFQRAYVSEIVGFHAEVGKKVGSRIDPLQIERGAAAVFEHKDEAQVWTMDKSEAAGGPSKPKLKGKDGRPSEINHGNIAPSIDSDAGGVTISRAEQSTVISLAALRKLRFAQESGQSDASVAARTAIAALGLAAIAYGWEADYDLRSRCLLVPAHGPKVEMVGRDGGAAEAVSIDPDSAKSLVNEAAQAASKADLPWDEGRVLTPAPKLVELITLSRDESKRQTPGEDG